MPIPTIVLTHAGGPHLDAYLAGLAASSEVSEVVVADAGGSTFAAAQKALGPKLKATGKDAVALLREHKPKLALVTMEAVLAPAAIDAALEHGCHVHAEKPACVRVADQSTNSAFAWPPGSSKPKLMRSVRERRGQALWASILK